MIHCSTTQQKDKEDWKLFIKTEEDYNKAVASGIAWVLYNNLPLSWKGCLKEINKEETDGV